MNLSSLSLAKDIKTSKNNSSQHITQYVAVVHDSEEYMDCSLKYGTITTTRVTAVMQFEHVMGMR